MPAPRSARARRSRAAAARRPGRSSAGEQLVENRHPDDQPALDLLRDQRVGRIDHLGRQLDAAVDRPWVHEQLARRDPARVDLVVGGVLADRGDEALAHALALHAKRVDHVRLADPVERVGDADSRAARSRAGSASAARTPSPRPPSVRRRGCSSARRGCAGRRRRSRSCFRSSEPRRMRSVYTSSSAWLGCSCLPSPALITEASVHRVTRSAAPACGERITIASGCVRAQRRDGVLQRLALVDRGARGPDRDYVGGQALRGELERGAGPGAGLEEEVDDRAPPQGRHLLDVAPAHLGEALGALHDPLDVGSLQVLDRQQVLHHASSSCGAPTAAPFPAAAPIVTSSTLVQLLDPDVDPLAARGRQVLAHVVGADRQLAMAAVDEHRELHPLRAPVVEQRVDRRPHGAAREQDVVDEDDVRPLRSKSRCEACTTGCAPGPRSSTSSR